MLRILVGVVAVLTVVVTGFVHGYWTDRWALREGPTNAATRVDSIPVTLGDWEGDALDNQPRLTDGIAGYMYRRYVNRQNGQSVVVALFCGRAGPMSVHTPDVCYAGGGYEIGQPSRHTLSLGPLGAPAELMTAQFTKTSASDRSQLRIFWSWNATGAWVAPNNPRFTFAPRPYLYKLYVMRETFDSTESLDNEPCLELMKTLLPELQRCLFPPS